MLSPQPSSPTSTDVTWIGHCLRLCLGHCLRLHLDHCLRLRLGLALQLRIHLCPHPSTLHEPSPFPVTLDSTRLHPSTPPSTLPWTYPPTPSTIAFVLAPPPLTLHPRLGTPAAIIPASSLLYCENSPAEVTEDILSVLFQQFVLHYILRTCANASAPDFLAFREPSCQRWTPTRNQKQLTYGTTLPNRPVSPFTLRLCSPSLFDSALDLPSYSTFTFALRLHLGLAQGCQ